LTKGQISRCTDRGSTPDRQTAYKASGRDRKRHRGINSADGETEEGGDKRNRGTNSKASSKARRVGGLEGWSFKGTVL
jgi:hypothetical protein